MSRKVWLCVGWFTLGAGWDRLVHWVFTGRLA